LLNLLKHILKTEIERERKNFYWKRTSRHCKTLSNLNRIQRSKFVAPSKSNICSITTLVNCVAQVLPNWRQGKKAEDQHPLLQGPQASIEILNHSRNRFDLSGWPSCWKGNSRRLNLVYTLMTKKKRNNLFRHIFYSFLQLIYGITISNLANVFILAPFQLTEFLQNDVISLSQKILIFY